MEFNGAPVFGCSLVGGCVITQIGTREFFLERVLKVVGVPEKFMAVEHGDVGHSQYGSRSQFRSGDVHPCEVGIVGDDLPCPRGGVGLLVIGSNNVLVGLSSVVLIDGGLGLVNVDRRRYRGAVNGVR